MKELVGKTIVKLMIDKDEQQYLVFETTEGELAYIAYGDCCSESWFADIFSVGALVGSTVISVEEIEMPSPEDNRTRQEYDEAYGYKFKTTKGYADVVFRNSSNGYYGGWLELILEVPSKVDLMEVTEDYSA